jgi:hypothetical protein
MVSSQGEFLFSAKEKRLFMKEVYSYGTRLKQFCRTAKLGTARRAGAEGQGTGCAESIKSLFDAGRGQKGPCDNTI